MTMELIADGLCFPEGPVAMADGSVIVVEIAASRVSRCWAGKRETNCEIGGGPNGAAMGPGGALYICNNAGMDLNAMPSHHGPGAEGRIERLDLSTGTVERIYEPCEGVKAALTSGDRNPAISFVRHHITNPLITVDGDSAAARSYFAVTSNNGPDHSGTYADILVRTPDGWRFAKRQVRIDWQAETSLFRPMVTR